MSVQVCEFDMSTTLIPFDSADHCTGYRLYSLFTLSGQPTERRGEDGLMGDDHLFHVRSVDVGDIEWMPIENGSYIHRLPNSYTADVHGDDHIHAQWRDYEGGPLNVEPVSSLEVRFDSSGAAGRVEATSPSHLSAPAYLVLETGAETGTNLVHRFERYVRASINPAEVAAQVTAASDRESSDAVPIRIYLQELGSDRRIFGGLVSLKPDTRLCVMRRDGIQRHPDQPLGPEEDVYHMKHLAGTETVMHLTMSKWVPYMDLGDDSE